MTSQDKDPSDARDAQLTEEPTGRLDRLKVLFPGLLICATIAAAARYLSEHYGAPQMLFALLIGMAFHFILEDSRYKKGVEFSAKTILRVGVALLGLRITVGDVASLGWEVALLVACGVLTTILLGFLLSKILGFGRDFGVLTGGSVAICGASAALAISSVLPKNKQAEQHLIFTVIAVTSLSTVAMVIYPVIVTSMGLDDTAAGVFLGGTIHDVAQVVGAGYTVSLEAGDTSTITKLFRVALLVPTVLCLTFLFRKSAGGDNDQATPNRFPLFLIGFCVCVGINSVGVVPLNITEFFQGASKWFLVIAVTALGVKTSLKAMFSIGYKPFLMVVLETLYIAAFIMIGIHVIGLA